MREMLEFFSVVSKYLIALCMAFYTLDCFLVFRNKDASEGGFLYLRQIFWIFAIQFAGFYNLAYISRQKSYLILYAFIQLFLLIILCMTPLIYRRLNRLLLNNMCMLFGIGLMIISRLSLTKAARQLMIIIISYMISMLVPLFITKLKILSKLTWLYAAVGISLLGIVFVLGETTLGAKLSFEIYGITFQPSEPVKLLFVFFLAGALAKESSVKRILLVSVIAGLHVIILVLSKDLGSALIFFVIYLVMVFIASRKYIYLLSGILGGCMASVAAYHLFSHVQVRVLAWQDPWSYIDNQGYQITQSLFAIGTGSWFGMGLYQGTPGDIPFVEQDSVFSAICEEMGTIFGIFMLFVILSSFLMIIKIALKNRNMFYRLIACGFASLYIFQSFLTIGGSIKFIPLTGVTLPFVSYGGSSVITTMLMFFILHSINMVELKDSESNKSCIEVSMQKNVPAKDRRREIYSVTMFFVILFITMMFYLGYFVATNEQEIINNTYNSRQEIILSKNYRGKILTAGRDVIAQTVGDGEGNEIRIYPYDNLFSHIAGYSTNGKTGIESRYNYYLINSDISLAQKIANTTAGYKNPGNNVITTLDLKLQQAASNALGIYKGAIIVTEVSTGKILAMVSKPDFDPNEIADIWSDLQQDTSSSILLNRATQGLYPPGSTFKIITALEYIRENPKDYEEYTFNCKGYYKVGENRINCYHKSVHNKIDLTKSFAKSCNSSFANIGMSLDRDAFSQTLDTLLFNTELPWEFLYAQSSTPITPSVSDASMLQASIGQGEVLMTPFHLNLITAAIANNGVLMTPYVVDAIEDANANVLHTYAPKEYAKLMSEEESEELCHLMTAVIENGTGSKLKGYGYSAGGKTGSAEYNSKNDSHAWFTGFAPAENPEIAVTVIIEGAGSGGDYAVPMARRVFDAYFKDS